MVDDIIQCLEHVGEDIRSGTLAMGSLVETARKAMVEKFEDTGDIHADGSQSQGH